MRRRNTFCLMTLITLLVSLILVSWEIPAQALNGKIVIGRVDATSGAFKYKCEPTILGAKYAVDEINAKGGLLGKEVVLAVEDSAFKADVAIRKATKLILDDKVDILMAGMGSHVVLAMMGVAEKHKKILLVDTAEADSITGKDSNPYVFRITGSTGQRTAATMSYFAKYTKFKKYYIFCMDFSLGREGGDGFRKNLKRIPGGQLVGEEYHPIGLKDFAPYMTKIIASGAEVILTVNYGNDLTYLIKTAASLGCKAITGGSYLLDPVSVRECGDAALGHLVLAPHLPDMGNLVQKSFFKEFQEKNKHLDKVQYNPYSSVQCGYTTCKWLFEVIKKAGSTDAEKIVKAWEVMSYDAIFGKLTMRACDHQPIQSYKATLIVRENEFYPFPFLGKPVVIPAEEVTVPPTETGNPRCK